MNNKQGATGSPLILDTDVVSYLMKGGNLANTYRPYIQGRVCSITFITVGEMYYGAEKAKWGNRRRGQLETHLRNFSVIPYDHEIARCYGKLVAEQKNQGNTVAPNDAWIAACAIRHGVPLVTHNAKHFVNISQLKVITKSHP